MITIQSGMLIALGFLTAVLLGLLTAPAFWARAVRLTTRRLKETMPLSEMEIEADRDRIRAEYAIKMHKLETLVERVKMAGARQQIDINRRDARVNMLEADLERLKASYEEAQNARRVLEQAIADRLPRVETRLTDAKKLLHGREREIEELTRTAERQTRALAEASAIGAQQQSEIERMSALLAARSRGGDDGQRSESEVALRAELEALRAKNREQAQLLARMQSLAGRPAGAAEPDGDAARVVLAPRDPTQADLERQLRMLRGRNDDQAGEIARLKAAISVFEREDGAGGQGVRESRIALKARVESLEAQSSQQGETILKLRSELAAANERLARQAAHFTGELRRLGTTGGTGGRGRAGTASPQARTSLAERVALARSPGAGASGDKFAESSQPGAGEKMAAVDHETAGTGGSEAVPLRREDRSAIAAVEEAVDSEFRSAETGNRQEPEAKPVLAAASGGARPRLLERIAGIGRSS
ncbi:MAG: hypothetical protein SFW09_15500 [Hyphomicrobiaceae bacterium]|nr:hypothetical protein [Hyphomicrobiaceae bacterium]